MAGARVLVMIAITGEAEGVVSAVADTLTTGDAVGASPFSVIEGVDEGIEGEDVEPCTESSETTALATICTTGADGVTGDSTAEDTTKGEVTPSCTIKVEDPDVAIE